MRKHLIATLLLAGAATLGGQPTAWANPEPQSQGQGTVTIKGTVLDESNEPVIGASVIQKGAKKNAVTTDFDGNFTIRVPRGSSLQISFIGYKTAEARATDGMQIYLQPTTEMLNEVVAIGYGSQKRANLTGAVATVDVARALDSRPVTDVAKALQGAVPGLTITMANGDINDNPTINIRGVGTLSNGHSSAPLIVVDGVPVDDLSFINPEDIEDISVLKDASSSAIYGTRAAFGVILVTTKTASKVDRVSVKYNNNFGWSKATVLPEFNTTVDNLLLAMDDTNPGKDTEIFGMYYDEILPFARAWAAQHGGKKYDSLVELQPFDSWGNVGDYWMFPKGTASLPAGNDNVDYANPLKSSRFISYADWDIAKTMFHAAPSNKHNVSLEGTSGNTNYRVSFGYDGKEGLMRYNPDKLHRYMANASIDTKITKWLKAGARINFSDREYKTPNMPRNQYQYMWRWPGQFENYGFIKNADGEMEGFRNDATMRLNAHMDKYVTTQTRLQGWAQAEIIKGLTLQADFTYALRNQQADVAAIPYSTYDQWIPGTNSLGNYEPWTQNTSYAQRSSYRDQMWTANVFGTYQHTFASDYNLKVMLGWTAEQETYGKFSAKRTGLLDYNLPNLNLTNGETYTTSAVDTHRATTGFFGRINFDYKGIYLLEVNGRYDGSSRFPANDQWAFFPSFSAGYRFSEEKYFAPVKHIISNAKIRASWGQVGNEAIGDNMFLSVASPVSAGSVYWLNGNQELTMFGMPSLVSSTLTWERIQTTDVGLDLGFFNNSLNLGFDWYSRDTKDMLAPGQVLPGTLGASAPYENSGQLRTNGWELSLSWNHSFGEADVYVNFNLADAKTKIKKWNNPSQLIYTYLPGSFTSYTEGTNFGDIWGFETQGYFTKDDFTWDAAAGKYVPAQGVASQTALETVNFKYGPGDIRFVDQNGDGVINNGDPNMKDENGKPIAVGSMRNHGDLKVIGNAMPRYEYSFHLGGAWKGFDLDLFFQGVGKRKLWATGSTIVPMAQSGYGTFSNQLSYNKIYYQEDGQIDWNTSVIDQNNDYPRMYSGCVLQTSGAIANVGQGMYNFYPQDRYLVNLAYLRMKNLTFGYTIPADLTTKAYIQRARIYFSADNLFFLYNGAKKYQLDPEMTTGPYTGRQGANDNYGTYGRTVPMMRTYSFGIQVTF